MGIDIDRLATQLKADEGFRPRVYMCSEGKQTVGYGINLEAVNMPERIASLWLDDEIFRTISSCEAFPWFGPLSDLRKEAIINMAYQLGITGVSKFKNMIAAIEEGDFNKAANEMRNSRWMRQTPERCERAAVRMNHNA